MIRKLLKLVALALAVAAVAGCANTPTPSSPAARIAPADGFSQALAAAPAALRPALTLTEQEGPRNAVRNLADLAVAAMRAGEYALAERALDAAIARIDSILPDDVNAARAKSRFTAEDVKDFKGEPYERAMVYYYRGLLFAQRGDFQNARAAFLAGGWQAAVTPQERFGKSFGLLSLLGAWASTCDGDELRARDLRAAAEREDGALKALPPAAGLVLVEQGRGPVKTRAGKHGELLTFAAGSGGGAAVKASAPRAGGRPWEASLTRSADLLQQATSRDGRPIDGILEGKAQFKDGSQTVGQVATAVGYGMLAGNVSGDRDMFNIGAMASVIGGIATMLSAATKPAADTRQLRLLPGEIHVGPLPAAVAASRLSVQVGDQPVELRPLVDRAGCQLKWASHGGADLDAHALVPDRNFADPKRQPEFRRELAALIQGGVQ